MDHLTERVKFSTAITPTAGVAAATELDGAVCTNDGFDGQAVLVRFGAITAGAATSIKIQQGAVSDLSDAADLAGSNITVADTDDDKTFIVDATQVSKRYWRVVVLRATQNAVVASANYMQYLKGTAPVTAHGTGVTVLRLSGPLEGTP